VLHAQCDLSQLSAPLYDLLNAAKGDGGGSKAAKALERISLADVGWSKVHTEAFYRLNETLANAMEQAYPQAGWPTRAYTDESDGFWAGMVTQYPPDDQEKPPEERNHRPLAFYSGAFKDDRLHWSTLEKERFAVVPEGWVSLRRL
jgi:RNase H-like domain found in reverse transcriptase